MMTINLDEIGGMQSVATCGHAHKGMEGWGRRINIVYRNVGRGGRIHGGSTDSSVLADWARDYVNSHG